MGHGKETPRQKMIGMMYLVLMAMLALNVSKDVLEAFVLVDHSLTKTTENSTAKNEIYYTAFDKAAAENPVKAGPWKAKADEVHHKSNELYNHLQELKIEIIKKTDGEDAEAVDDHHHIHTADIKAKDDNTKVAEYMIGGDLNGEAYALKGMIENYRDELKAMTEEDAEDKRASLDSILVTSDPPYTEEHGSITWEQEYFAHLPMVAVITIMSKLQSDVRNAESEMLEYLYAQIDEGSFKFNKLESVVTSNSNYLIRGTDYNASVFMAAFDTTQVPKIFVGEIDSTVSDEGIVDYFMKGELGRDYDSLPVVSGRGVYKRSTSTTGQKSWGGIISLKRGDGTYTNKPFHAEYRVGDQALIVSPDKMNVFYQGLDNPISVSSPGTATELLRGSVNNGKITGSGGSYIVVPTRLGPCEVSVTATIDGKTRSLGSVPFRVKETPDPYATLAGVRGGTKSKSDVLKELGLMATMPDWFEFDLEFTITGYEFSITSGVFTQREVAKSGDLTSTIRALIRDAAGGTRVYFEEITAVGPDGRERNLGTLAIKLR